MEPRAAGGPAISTALRSVVAGLAGSLLSLRAAPEHRAISQLVFEIARLGVLPFGATLFALQYIARELGHWAGRRRANREQQEVEGVGIIVGGMLGLLAFVLALTLSFSNARYQERRDGTMQEANAIGTAWLRAEAVGHPRGAEIARLLESYAEVRRDFITAPMDAERIAAIIARSDALQAEFWGHAAALAREQPNPFAVSVMTALNDVIDESGKQRLAFAAGIPPTMFWLLIGMTIVSMSGLGYQLGLRGMRLRGMSFMLILMWSVVMTSILDLGSPRLGDVRAGTGPIDWTIQGFRGGIVIPPPPAPR